MAEAGANVVLAARSVDKLDAVATKIEAVGAKCIKVKTDVQKSADIEALVQATVDEFGTVNCLVNMDTSDEDPSNQLLGSSITYRIALGPQQGRKVFTLQTLPDCQSGNSFSNSVGEVAGFSLHAGVATKANEREKLERLCRYITRPAVSTRRLSMTRNGRVRYELKTPWRNGTTHIIFEPLDFVSRLVSLVPKPRVNLTRFHGVFAPNCKYRAMVTPAKRGNGKKVKTPKEALDQTPAEKHISMTWAMRLKRVFDIDIETCSECGGDVRIIASIEDPVVIRTILAHLDKKGAFAGDSLLPDCRASPSSSMGLLL